ncbi:MAG: diadenylate cyclase CdaA [Anaerolineae bacterium]|nr:diadenylate cyclase CdaA [Anaerolineae bacterium]
MWELSWLIERLSWPDLIDIALVATLFFALFYALRGTRAVPLIRGITALLFSLALLSRLVRLQALSWLVTQILPVILVAVPVIFQPELRRALERLGRGRLFSLTTPHDDSYEHILEATVVAARQMAARKIGALIVFERETGLQEQIETGIPLDATVTSELLTTIFDPNTVLHDGAVIIREGRIAAAACVMPLTSAFLSDRHLGLRHRAAIGTTEDSDAVAVVVSEERGRISITHNGRIIRDLEGERLEAILGAFFAHRKSGSSSALQRWRRRNSQRGSPVARGGRR